VTLEPVVNIFQSILRGFDKLVYPGGCQMLAVCFVRRGRDCIPLKKSVTCVKNIFHAIVGCQLNETFCVTPAVHRQYVVPYVAPADAGGALRRARRHARRARRGVTRTRERLVDGGGAEGEVVMENLE